jgi:hypothetical protein
MANRSIRDDRGPLQRPITLPPAMQQPQTKTAQGGIGGFAPAAPLMPKPAPTLGQPPVPIGGRPGDLPQPQTKAPPPPMPPAPMPGATGPGTASPGVPPGLMQPGGTPQMRR